MVVGSSEEKEKSDTAVVFVDHGSPIFTLVGEEGVVNSSPVFGDLSGPFA